ncbi:MAG TPA: TIR domain-containing protein, partial [Allosphingosinicella sp.]|nr:TIR domain-containing protein [Allosphingosinicella sp.]
PGPRLGIGREEGLRLADIFISYASPDRAVALRVRDALEEAGYEVFWDQSTPPGKDWDSWIREQLAGARLVIALWTKASVASPNVRHEAIIAREAEKILPVMVDDLKPTDFPMGLFMVQALLIGRSQRQFNAVKAKFLEEVRARIGDAAAAPRPARTGKDRRKLYLGLGAGALLAAALLLVFLPRFLAPGAPQQAQQDPDAPAVTAQQLRASIEGERGARARLALRAERTLAEPELIGTSWAWAVGQLISGAPEESRALEGPYFAYLQRAVRPECGCFLIYNTEQSIGNAWVIIASARLRHPAPQRLLETILAAQNPEGWWAISFTARPDDTNAAVHATAVLTIALAEARRAGVIPAPLRPRVDAAIARAVGWLNRGPREGARWTDYPNDERRTESLVFAAMATVATASAGDVRRSHAAQAFVRSVRSLPAPTENSPSSAYVELANGQRFFDSYRHPPSPWIGAAAVLAYAGAAPADKARLRPIIRQWLAVDFTDENLLRQDWIAAETLFLRALAFRALE